MRLLKTRHLPKSPLMTRKLSKHSTLFKEKPAYAGFFYDGTRNWKISHGSHFCERTLFGQTINTGSLDWGV